MMEDKILNHNNLKSLIGESIDVFPK